MWHNGYHIGVLISFLNSFIFSFTVCAFVCECVLTGIQVHKEAKRMVYDALELEIQAN